MIDARAGRPRGFWTREKLRILDDYLRAFTRASKSVGERIYLDAFAGVTENIDRETGGELRGSARIALEVDDPPFTQFHYFELASKAADLEQRLRGDYPGRRIEVHPGDCNVTLPAALEPLPRWAPTFAFLDPDGMELAWTTIEALADHKRASRYKVELWILFTAAGFQRTLALRRALTTADEDRASRLFGTDQWKVIHDLRRADAMSGGDAREQYVNLLRWRLERVLGYSHTHALELLNAQGVSVYHLVFATDNATGNKIMSSIYARAAREFPQMRQQAWERQREQRSGQPRLFESDAAVSDEELHTPGPPWPPPGIDDA